MSAKVPARRIVITMLFAVLIGLVSVVAVATPAHAEASYPYEIPDYSSPLSSATEPVSEIIVTSPGSS